MSHRKLKYVDGSDWLSREIPLLGLTDEKIQSSIQSSNQAAVSTATTAPASNPVIHNNNPVTDNAQVKFNQPKT